MDALDDAVEVYSMHSTHMGREPDQVVEARAKLAELRRKANLLDAYCANGRWVSASDFNRFEKVLRLVVRFVLAQPVRLENLNCISLEEMDALRNFAGREEK